MKKTELKELYQMMFPNYPDIVTVKQLQVVLWLGLQVAQGLPVWGLTTQQCDVLYLKCTVSTSCRMERTIPASYNRLVGVVLSSV